MFVINWLFLLLIGVVAFVVVRLMLAAGPGSARQCRRCGQPCPPVANYCPRCGQKV
jgi:hypothetical protein